ncbi:MAG: hypothetical protein M1358_10955 [Chloroflexi bacterium]|nr:hypothetical protein [Chloroflexota bacterium]
MGPGAVEGLVRKELERYVLGEFGLEEFDRRFASLTLIVEKSYSLGAHLLLQACMEHMGEFAAGRLTEPELRRALRRAIEKASYPVPSEDHPLPEWESHYAEDEGAHGGAG